MKTQKKNSHILRNLIITLIILLALAALVLFVFIPIYSQKETTYGEAPVVNGYDGDGKVMVLENDRLLFELDPTTTQFQITDKANGKIWYSNPKDKDSDPIALSSNKEELYSTFDVTYTTNGGEVALNNYAYCQQNQTYAISQPDADSIQIDYSIGKIEREYLLPTFITKERYVQFTDNMKKATKKKVSSNYTLIEPEKLNKVKDLDTVLAMCPSIETEAIYMLKSDTSATNKEKIEGYFAEAGYNADELAIDQALVTGKRDNNGPVFNATVIYRLDGPDLIAEVPYTSLRCEGDNPMTYISVLPMFGAAGPDQNGFMMIPEGGGALIDFNNGKLSQSPYYANLYGWDYATERTEVVSETRNAFPVFGIGQEDGSFICIMEGATAYGGICADIAGRFNNYNTVYGKYNVLHYDKFNVSNRTAQLLYMYETAIPDDTLIQRYRFIESGSYVDMANAYGEYLRSIPDARYDVADAEMPVNVELVGAINKFVSKAGLPVDSALQVTTFAQSEEIMNELLDGGVKNLFIRMTGWCNGGVRQRVLTSIHPEGILGGEKQMRNLIAAAKEAGVKLSFDGINCFAYDSGLFEGFLPFSHAARLTTREQVVLYNYDIVTYHQADWQDTYYLTRPDYAQKNASNLINWLKDKGADGIAFRDIGNLLSADYYNRNTVTREEVLKMNVETLKEANAAGLHITIKAGNDYAIPYAELITDMNLTGNAYAIIDRKIPFYEIALHGMKDYTGEAINLAGDYQTALLESAEYGAGLNFTFMKEDTMILQDSQYSCYNSAAWDRWKEQLIPMITRYQTEMSGLNKLTINDHEFLADQVTVTGYEDGTKVYVNYGTTEWTGDGVTVPARDYLVERGSQE